MKTTQNIILELRQVFGAKGSVNKLLVNKLGSNPRIKKVFLPEKKVAQVERFVKKVIISCENYSNEAPDIPQNLLKNAFIFSITVSLFCVLSPVGVNLETGGRIFANPVPVVCTYPSRKALWINL